MTSPASRRCSHRGDGSALAVDANGRFDLEDGARNTPRRSSRTGSLVRGGRRPARLRAAGRLGRALRRRRSRPARTCSRTRTPETSSVTAACVRTGTTSRSTPPELRPRRVPAGARELGSTAGRRVGASRTAATSSSLHIAAGLQLGGNESYPGVFEPIGGFADGVPVVDGRVRPGEAPGIGIEEKAELYRVCRELLDQQGEPRRRRPRATARSSARSRFRPMKTMRDRRSSSGQASRWPADGRHAGRRSGAPGRRRRRRAGP